ncbi:hypothetical protein M9H77_06234 [Catharanthus roseus]|uniref:Uncharacterized protein n=1 Tax=Catharanthus roseus TaxID=4058 RepID=A0ACC0BRN8_CATRO|nr:hypothetical protein M9H77_06234 [Catharanthus roseus]
MKWSFMLLPPVDRLHCHLVSGLHAIYSTSWVAHSSVIRVTTLFLPDYGHCCRMRVLLGGSLGMLPVLRICTGIWTWIYLYFPMFALPVRQGTEACKPYIKQFPMLGYKNENKLLDIRLGECRTGCRRFGLAGFPRYISVQPIQLQEACRPPNNRMYVLRNTFVEALWIESLKDTESREYSQWLSLTDSSRYVTPGSVGFGCT